MVNIGMLLPIDILITIFQLPILRDIWSAKTIVDYATVCKDWREALYLIRQSHYTFFRMVYDEIVAFQRVHPNRHKWFYPIGHYFRKYFYNGRRFLSVRVAQEHTTKMVSILKKYFRKVRVFSRKYSGFVFVDDIMCWYPRGHYSKHKNLLINIC